MLARLVNVGLGVWLMAAPALLGYAGPAAMNDRIVGPIAASVAFIAVWEVARGLRWVNLLMGLWLALAPWVLGYGITPLINSTVIGLLMAALAPIGGRIQGSYGGGWASLWRGGGAGSGPERGAEAA